MERFETVDDLANADLDELTAFLDEKGKNFADPAAKAKAIRSAARDSYRLPVTVNSSVNQAMAVSIASMRALEKQVKVLDKAIEQQFEIIPNTLTSIPGIGKVYSAGIIAEIGDIRRFDSQASVAKFAGLVSVSYTHLDVYKRQYPLSGHPITGNPSTGQPFSEKPPQIHTP